VGVVLETMVVRVCLLLALSFVTHACAQGTLNFNNRVMSVGLDAPVYYQFWGNKAQGASLLTQLYAGPDPASLVPVGAAVPFRTGPGAGYWDPAPDASRIIPTVAPGQIAFVKVVGWDTAVARTYQEAWLQGAIGESSVFSVITGGDGQPPGLPLPLLGLTSFVISPIPESVPLSLMLLGGGLVLLWSFRKASASSAHRQPPTERPNRE
jgi:hypothetical protein